MAEKIFRILAINPGSTSTKIAIYENEKETRRESIEHPRSEIERYKAVADQYPLRKDAVLAFLRS
ncbi:MAG TPA: butyrate kinase, partial [Magnetospirillaceae bacterium]|nr:butyrate kinase [Magnetospirillaceae bacterium]